MVRNLLLFLLALSVLLLAAIFAALNPGTLEIDLAFVKLESAKSLAFILAFGAGCVVGALGLGVGLVRVATERRRLRKALKLAEAEVQNLRSIPVDDAN